MISLTNLCLNMFKIKKKLSRLQNVILTYWEHDHFAKGGNPGFSSKI